MAAGYGYTEVLHMAWTDARDFAHAAARAAELRSSAQALNMAVAVRMAHHADAKAWGKWVRALGAGG